MPFPPKINPDRIVEQALALLAVKGWPAVSMRDLAAELGVRASSLYRHFPDRDALEAALADQVAAVLRERMDAAAEGKQGAGALRAAAEAYVRLAREDWPLFALLVGNPDAAARGGGNAKRLWSTLLHIVGQVTGNPDDTAAAVAVWSFLHGFVMLEKAGQFGPSGPRGGFEVGITALIHGLSDRAT